MMSIIEPEDDILARVSARVGDAAPAKSATSQPPEDLAQPSRVWTLPGIAGATRVSTNFGEVPAHLIRVRDKLRTREGRYLPVLRIEEYKLDEEFLRLRPEARPVLIGPHASGGLKRSGNVILSPAQLVASPSDSGDTSGVRADELSRQRVTVDSSLGRLSYFVFDLGEPTVLRCEGLWVHSAYDYV